jgi:hypothetical protein
MAIQMRRGAWSQFDPTKMLPGEWAVILSGHPDTLNGQALYHCFAAGSVKQIATIEDAATIIANATEDIRDELTQDIASALAQVGAATNAANAATANATTATSAANAATQAATSASERAEDAIDAMGDISELAVPLMSPDVRGGAKLDESGGLALRDGALGIGSLVQESDGYARGGLAEVTAKGHAEQDTTVGKNLFPRIVSQTVQGVTFAVANDGSITFTGTATGTLIKINAGTATLAAGTYTLSDSQFGTGYRLQVNHTQTNNVIAWTSYASTDTFTLSEATQVTFLIVVVGGSTPTGTAHPQLELGSTATEYEPYTGGAPSPSPDYPQEIQVVRGRNLLPITSLPTSTLGLTFSWTDDGGIRMYGKPTSSGVIYLWNDPDNPINIDDTAIFSNSQVTNGKFDIYLRTVSDRIKIPNSQTSVSVSPAAYSAVSLYVSADSTYDKVLHLQLEKGDHATPYVPYGHVGLEVRDSNDQLISTTPIPLPSRGWAGSLHDGTADKLTLDGAGKVTWELKTEIATKSDTRTYNSWATPAGYTASFDAPSQAIELAEIMCNKLIGGTTWDIARRISIDSGGRIRVSFETADGFPAAIPFDYLYPLATPVTEDCGYEEDWPTNIPEGAVISIPELDEVGIRYFVDSTVTELAWQWYARANSEYADRLTALEQAVAELATS